MRVHSIIFGLSLLYTFTITKQESKGELCYISETLNLLTGTSIIFFTTYFQMKTRHFVTHRKGNPGCALVLRVSSSLASPFMTY
jgi:hypothetical protein